MKKLIVLMTIFMMISFNANAERKANIELSKYYIDGSYAGFVGELYNSIRECMTDAEAYQANDRRIGFDQSIFMCQTYLGIYDEEGNQLRRL